MLSLAKSEILEKQLQVFGIQLPYQIVDDVFFFFFCSRVVNA
uniref:Uncharacterized protein n=1 Tax=Arundo donax TaxID=35708 RepID=A0A0A9DB73_ARUDO